MSLDNIEIGSIDLNKPYLIQINVGNMSKDQVQAYCNKVKEALQTLGIERTLIIPYWYNDLGKLTITEINEEVKKKILGFFNDEQANTVEKALARIGV